MRRLRGEYRRIVTALRLLLWIYFLCGKLAIYVRPIEHQTSHPPNVVDVSCEPVGQILPAMAGDQRRSVAV